MAPSTAQPPPVAGTSSTASPTPEPTDLCRVQIRLPNGRVIRHNFPCSASLNDVTTFVIDKEPHFPSDILVQILTHDHLSLSLPPLFPPLRSSPSFPIPSYPTPSCHTALCDCVNSTFNFSVKIIAQIKNHIGNKLIIVTCTVKPLKSDCQNFDLVLMICTCGFDLCPLSEVTLYRLLSFGGMLAVRCPE